MKTTLIGTAVALLVGVGSAAAQQTPAQPTTDTRWQPWIGCWQLLGESVQDESDLSAEEVATGAPAAQSRANAGTRVCIAPAAKAGVTMTTLVGRQAALEQTIVADGVEHQMADSACRGTQRNEWSKNGRRLFTTANVACGDEAPRKVSSLTMMTIGPVWVDVQLIDIAGRKSIRVRRYEPVSSQTAQGAAAAAPSLQTASVAPYLGEKSWTIDDVKEASAKLAPETVQAALVELREGFNLSAKRLVELDDAGVSDNVIDLMIALTFPKKFVVDHPVGTSGGGYYGGGIYGAYSGDWPWIADSLFWPSYYSPFAYRYWGYYDPYYVPSSGYVAIQPTVPTDGAPTGTGRVVDGRGYTQIRTREPEPVRSNFFGSGNNGTTSASSGSSSSGSTGSSGASSSGGYSSGGGGGDTGRTAVPRPPGGN